MTDINPELTERANRARMAYLRGKPLADHEYKALRSQVEVDALSAALSAVAPLIAAQALEDAADEVGRVREAIRLAQGVISPPHIAMILAGYDQADGVIRERAAKLRSAS